MEKITHFPLRAQEDALKRGFILNGFELIDDDVAHEVEPRDWAVQLFKREEGEARTPLFLDDGSLAMRSELLAAQLPRVAGRFPFRGFSVDSVYDARDAEHPRHRVIQGVIVPEGEQRMRSSLRFGNQVAQTVFGIGAKAEVKSTFAGALTIEVAVGERTFPLAKVGKATPIARALLGIADPTQDVWFFEVDVDDVTMATYGIATRDELYSPLVADLKKYTDDVPTFGELYAAHASNLLRKMGFCEFSGLAVYEEDCYRKMNMIQESWDKNNAGIQLAEPLGKYTGMPTVLTPALEEALAANWKAGEKECKIFEMRHIFLPGKIGKDPIEKVALSFGAYGPDLDGKAWRSIVDKFLSDFGIANHFFIPLPTGKAPAYDETDGWILMDQNMTYLESNFGGINPQACANHGIEAPAFMAQFEFAPIEKKAIEEFDFVLPDYQ